MSQPEWRLSCSWMLQLQVLARTLSGCIVTSSARLSEAAIKTVLSGGCKAIVCRKRETEESEEPPHAAAFFSTLYKQLYAGCQLTQASSLDHLMP